MSSNSPLQVNKRLAKALKYLELARVSRELDYSAIPFVLAAEHLVKLSIERQQAISNDT